MSSAAWTPSENFTLADAAPYELVVAGPAARAIAEVPPEAVAEAVAAAVIALVTGDLLSAPRGVGKPLRRELEGLWVARRGTFRVVYRIDDDNHAVVVLRVDHRGGLYRAR